MKCANCEDVFECTKRCGTDSNYCLCPYCAISKGIFITKSTSLTMNEFTSCYNIYFKGKEFKRRLIEHRFLHTIQINNNLTLKDIAISIATIRFYGWEPHYLHSTLPAREILRLAGIINDMCYL